MLIYLQMIELDDDKIKFENIYLAYKDLMFNLAMKRLNNPQKSEDLVHDVFIKIAEKVSQIDPVGIRTKHLVITMVENQIIDLFRSKAEQLETVNTDLVQNIGVEDKYESGINACIKKLPEQQRNLIWFKYSLGYKNSEISQLMGVSVAWIQKNEQRAKRKLMELYREEDCK